MKRSLFVILLLAACSSPQYLHKAVHDGVEISYYWKHQKEKPSELILRMTNVSEEDKRVSLVIDLYSQGKTVETLQADTCIKVGQSLNGKLNGVYFVPEKVTTQQINNGEVQIEMTRTFVEPLSCK
jgi:hypothetical protein